MQVYVCVYFFKVLAQGNFTGKFLQTFPEQNV